MSATRVLGVLGLALALGGCASLRLPPPPWARSSPPPPARSAAEQARLDREVAELLQRGRVAVAQARRHYAAALALDPQSRVARDALRSLPEAETVVRAESAAKPPARPSGRPEPPRGDDRPEVLYAVARTQLADGRDDEAYRTLVQLARVNPQYKDGAVLLGHLRSRLVQQHYQLGLLRFRDEQIEDAIAEWRLVLEIDAGHASARRNIEQAERILRTLAEQPPATVTPR
jgi:tetratricopeptide (TPR) repeat protein